MQWVRINACPSAARPLIFPEEDSERTGYTLMFTWEWLSHESWK